MRGNNPGGAPPKDPRSLVTIVWDGDFHVLKIPPAFIAI
jgi:hypothetical protein